MKDHGVVVDLNADFKFLVCWLLAFEYVEEILHGVLEGVLAFAFLSLSRVTVRRHDDVEHEMT